MKKIVFVTGTRADYGKLKSLIIQLEKIKDFKILVFVTGMHNLKRYGYTYLELTKDKIKNIKRFENQKNNDGMDTIISKTIIGFRKYISEEDPDLIVVHGDRVESLACAIVGCINNIKVAHIEGGEISGTIDEILRHSISKLSDLHFVTNISARRRLIQMGELSSSIFTIGSPDVDLILRKDLPTLMQVKKKYELSFSKYGIGIFHPVTNEVNKLKNQIKIFLKSIIKSNTNIVLIYPNNDLGTNVILNEYKKIKSKNIKIFPSIRFEYYLTLLKNTNFIIGNSSSGIMEAPYFGIPTINLGNRQLNRAKLDSIINCEIKPKILEKLIKKYTENKFRFKKIKFFGKGKSAKKFINILKKQNIWKIKKQKQFNEINLKY